MDIDEIRRINIRDLEKRAGSPRVIADLVGMTYVQYVNLRDGAKDPRSGKQRGMRKETAWRFEDAFQMPRGWLDTDHDAGQGAISKQTEARAYIVRPRHDRPLVQALCDIAERISDPGLQQAVGYLEALAISHPKVKPKRA
jgi:hypothetical protein